MGRWWIWVRERGWGGSMCGSQSVGASERSRSILYGAM